MCVGEERALTIPSRLAYGTKGVTASNGTMIVPPGADLHFTVLCVSMGPMKLDGGREPRACRHIARHTQAACSHGRMNAASQARARSASLRLPCVLTTHRPT